DRLRARVNNRLNGIEVKTEYHVEYLRIREQSINDEVFGCDDFPNIIFFEEKSYSSECIRRLARNVSVGELEIKLSGSSDFHREVYSLIKEFYIDDLHLQFDNDEMESEIMVDSFFFDLVRSCERLHLVRMDNVTAEALHRVYQNMMMDQAEFRKLRCAFAKKQTLVAFLRLIGITVRDGKLFSARRDLQAYESRYNGYILSFSIFDANLEMKFSHGTNEIFDIDQGFCDWRVHANRESLEEQQKYRIKVVIIPE
ncbi:hypothetical protein PMAYCL1PPCAC_27405, partial [Pristionchus mayeri]